MTVKQYLLGVKNIDMRIESLNGYPQEQKKLRAFKETVTNQIHGLRDNRHATLLEYRYLQGLKWSEVTDKLKYPDADYVRRHLHATSLREFEMQYPNYEDFYPLKEEK